MQAPNSILLYYPLEKIIWNSPTMKDSSNKFWDHNLVRLNLLNLNAPTINSTIGGEKNQQTNCIYK